ncbi:MAG: TRIC cation channel family protein [Tepidiformaceae bacterium]
MHVTASELVGILDRVGIVAFAFSGVEVGARRRLDLFGLLVMGIVTATGGGLMRDIVIGRVPFVIERWDYLLWAIAASVVAIAFVLAHRHIPKPLLAVADAGGLGAFAAAGAFAGIHADLPVTAVVVLAIVTATGGGVLRDLLADRVPLVLRAEVNATAAALGGLAVWLLDPVSTGGAALVGLALAASVRVVGIALDLHLPIPGRPGRGRQRRLL